MPASAKRRANGSRYISFTAPRPCAIATAGTRVSDVACSGRKNQPAAKVSPLLNVTSRLSIAIHVPLCSWLLGWDCSVVSPARPMGANSASDVRWSAVVFRKHGVREVHRVDGGGKTCKDDRVDDDLFEFV